MQDNLSITSVAETTRRPSLCLSSQDFSQAKVFPLILKEITEKAEDLESLGKQYFILNKNTSRSRGFSNTGIEDYGDILDKKGLFLEKLTQAVKGEVDNPLDGPRPKYTVHCYNQFSSLLETRCKESKQNIHQKTELLKEQKHETTQLTSLGDIFENLVEEDNEDLKIQEHRQASLQFEEAKTDLVKVINISYPNEEERKQFLLVMAELVEAHINNLDSRSIEDHYVEIQPINLKNPGLRSLMNGMVVVEHPQNPLMLRLSVDD